ncbi:Protein-glutamate O-methyltransferase [Altererythrobacter insulae]|nr:Protein-glutamate O-methyltransferase [Altererythrobacter insulae]
MHDVVGRSAEERRLRRATRWLVRFPRAIPILLFLIIAVFTAFSVLAIERSEERRERVVISEFAQTIAIDLDRRGNTVEAYLRSGAALFATAQDVQLPLFQAFASELRLDSNAQGSEAIGWAEVISSEESAAFEARMRAQKSMDYRIRQDGESDMNLLAPITYRRPADDQGRSALGFDLYSVPEIRDAMEESVARVRPTATGKLQLSSDANSESAGILILMPVFEGDRGERNLKGFIYSPFDAQYFLASTLEKMSQSQLGVALYDGADGDRTALASHPPALATGRKVSEEITIGNRPFVVEVESARAESLSPLSMATLLFGLATASLLLLVARLLARQAAEDEASLAFFAEQHSIRNSLTRELNHRVKNTLASIVSIISLTRRRTDNLDDFADSLEGRVRALSATHDLLTQSEWGTTPIRSVVEAELAPYSDDGTEVLLNGPDVELAPNDALSLGLAMHELATNAAKYGALSKSGGSLTVDWICKNDHLAELTWIERGGPEVASERQRGFGMELIEKIVAHELRHPVEMQFEPEGLSCRLHVPLRTRAEFELRQS